MKSLHQIFWYMSVVVMCVSPYVGAAAAPPHDWPGQAEAAGVLAKNHAYLFQESARKELDELNRLLREADSDDRAAKTDEDKAKVNTKRADAARRLHAVLEGYPGVVRVDLSGGTPPPALAAPFQFPGNVGMLLFCVERGQGETRCVAVNQDLVTREGVGTVRIPAASQGLTWAVVSFSNVPIGESSMLAEFQIEGRPPVRVPFEVRTPEPGQVHLSVLSADTRQPAPAMMRLVWKTDGLDYRPSNAVDITAQFEGQGNPSSRRHALLSGRLRGDYWCVPGPFSMPVQPGEWQVVIRRGVEHAPIFDTFTVAPGETVRKVYTPRRWVDMRDHGWYSGDDHVHFRMVSDDDAQRLMTWVRAEDIHVANVVKMGDISRTYFEQRGFGKDYRVIQDDYVLSPGQECPRTHDQLGHTLAMNTKSMVRDTEKYYLYDLVFDQVHEQGGLTGYAHGHADFFHVHRDMSINIPKNKIDFVEVMQFGTLGMDLSYEFLNLGFKVTLSAGSDVPWAGTVGEERLYAYVGKNRFNADRWFDAVKKGRTFVTNGPMIEFTVDGAMPGDELVVTQDRKLRVKARAWGDPETAVPSKLEVLRHGEVVRAAESTDPNGKELTLDFEIDPEHGLWIAARVQGNDGSQAHTTPVYVMRKPLRFWKFDAVQELLAKRRGNLEEIRQIVAEAQERNRQGKVEDNRAVKQLALQGDALLERVEASEAIYKALEETHQQEQAQRNGPK